MRVEQVMTTGVESCTRSSTLDAPARIMHEHSCGFVPVLKDDGSRELAGVITDRDICLAAYLTGKPLAQISTEEAMAHAVHSCKAEDSLALAEAIMRASHVHRLPVVDSDDRLVGVISVSDLARHATAEPRPGDVSEREVGETLTGISLSRRADQDPGSDW